jgi:hypothetical protein
MTGPRPAGDIWTADDDRKLMSMMEAKTDVGMIARKLKRTIGAVQSRRGKLRQLARRGVARELRSGDIGLDESS